MRVVIEVRAGCVVNVYAKAGTEVEIWDFDTLDEALADAREGMEDDE